MVVGARLRIDAEARAATVPGEPLRLTPQEFDLPWLLWFPAGTSVRSATCASDDTGPEGLTGLADHLLVGEGAVDLGEAGR